MWHHISTGVQARTGQAVSNFAQRLPAPDSELIQQTLKDPYLFDFLGLLLCRQRHRVVAEYALRGMT